MNTEPTTGGDPGPLSWGTYWKPEGYTSGRKSNPSVDVREAFVHRDLRDMERWGKQHSDDPYTWGFTLYKASAADERFTQGVEKLNRWLRYLARQTRYAGLDPDNKEYLELDARPTNGKIWPSRDFARRFKLEIVHDYPEKDTVVAGSEVSDGDEDFMAIGSHFRAWVDEHGLDTSDLYVRNDHSLIVDDKALCTLETLPEQPPPHGPTAMVSEDGGFLEGPQAVAWVWMLDREYYGRYLQGENLPPYHHPDEKRFQPWVRIYISDLLRVWFYRPRGMSPGPWDCVVERDQDKLMR